jgi:hypothetical protein
MSITAIISEFAVSTEREGPRSGAVVVFVLVDECSIMLLPVVCWSGAFVVAVVPVVPHRNVAINVDVPVWLTPNLTPVVAAAD